MVHVINMFTKMVLKILELCWIANNDVDHIYDAYNNENYKHRWISEIINNNI